VPDLSDGEVPLGAHVFAGCVGGLVVIAVVAIRSFFTGWDRGVGRGGVVG